jgi:hypothetical protein
VGRLRAHPVISFAVIALGLGVVYVLLAPWAYHIGDRNTLTSPWTGYGTVQASDGGRDVLYVSLGRSGFHSSGGHSTSGCIVCNNMSGSAKICTRDGQTYPLQLTAKIKTWWSTDGARTTLGFFYPAPGASKKGNTGWDFGLSGIWHGSVLPMTTSESGLAEVYTHNGATISSPIPKDINQATVTLRYGSGSAFAAACQALHHAAT